LALNATKDSTEKRGSWLEMTLFVVCAVVVGTLVLGLVFDGLYTMYRESLISVLNLATGFATLFANVVVLFYAFATFTRTKDRCVLIIAIAALVFAYGALWGLLYSVKPLNGARHMSHVETTVLFATRYSTHIIGLVLYTYGVTALIRRGRTNDLTKR
jgi:hypothetical protein